MQVGGALGSHMQNYNFSLRPHNCWCYTKHTKELCMSLKSRDYISAYKCWKVMIKCLISGANELPQFQGKLKLKFLPKPEG